MTTGRRASVGRIIGKDGSFRVKHSQFPPNFSTNIRNFFNFLVDDQWRWALLAVSIPFPITWLLFACLYYLISWQHGDFDQVTANATDHQLCIGNSVGFVSMFLFSLESQSTIGYGYRYITESCPLAIALLCLQYVTGALLEACAVSLVWIRVIRPKTRARQIIFSRYAVINSDSLGRLRFQIRVFDTSAKYLVQTWIRLYYAKKWRVESGSSVFTFQLQWMDLGQLYGKEKLLLLWPVEVTHIIDQASPLFKQSEGDEGNDFEIIAVVEGVVEATGLVTQTRMSYTAEEIKWNHVFAPITYTKEKTNLRLLSTNIGHVVPGAGFKG